MSLLQLQAAQFRLYLDPAARDSLRRGDRSLAVDFSLNETEFDQLRRMVVDQAAGIATFANMLVRKRDDRLAQYYPMVKRYLGSAWQARIDAFVRRWPIPAVSAAEDAVAFGEHLAGWNVDDADQGIAADLIVFERTKAEVAADSRPGGAAPPCDLRQPKEIKPVLAPTARIRTLRHHPNRLVDLVMSHSATALEPPPNGVVVVFFCGTGGLGVAASEVGAWLAAVLQKADGHSTLDEIVCALGMGDDPSVIETLSSVLERLREIGMIELWPAGSAS